MNLNESADVSDDIRRIINNGCYTHHPFKFSSGQLADFILIAKRIRALPSRDSTYCIDTIAEQVAAHKDCVGCYGRGLAFLKYLTKDVDAQRYAKYSAQYQVFYQTRDWPSDFEAELLQLIKDED